METFETVKGKFLWTESSIELLKDILQTVANNGGRIKMGYAITHKEAPEWFDKKVRNHFMWSLGNRLNVENKRAITLSRRATWTEADVEYLLKWWARLDYKLIARYLEKSKHAVRAKARSLMTDEEFDNRFYNRNKKKK